MDSRGGNVLKRNASRAFSEYAAALGTEEGVFFREIPSEAVIYSTPIRKMLYCRGAK